MITVLELTVKLDSIFGGHDWVDSITPLRLDTSKWLRPTVPPVRITSVDQFPVRALSVQVGGKVVESRFNMFARMDPSILRFSI